jgi:uncharacterized protein (DUF169 family)
MDESPRYDWKQIADDLNRLLRLKTTVIGMKLYETEEAMMAVPGLRRPTKVHATDQIVGMAARLGWTVGVTAADLAGAQCRAVIGLDAGEPDWREGKAFVGVWHATLDDSRKRQQALHVAPAGRFRAMAVSPVANARIADPDICLVYATPGQMIILINGLQYRDYRSFDWSVVGETACADSWGRALAKGEPSLSLPCYAERRYGGVPDDEMLMALPPKYLTKAIEGMEALAKNGLRYPIPPYGIQNDPREGMAVSYGERKS